MGTLTVTGLTVQQIREQVVKGLRKKLVTPEVAVEVLRPRPRRVFISGAVKASQSAGSKEGWRVTEALAAAGGLVLRPEVARGTLFRLPDQTIVIDLARIYVEQDPTANLRLQPGDVVDIQEAPTVRIYVGGHVNSPGLVDLYRGVAWWTRSPPPRGRLRAPRSARATSSRRTAPRSRSIWPASSTRVCRRRT